MNTAVIVVGILLLVALAICIGSSLDTEAQRVAAREAARERRERNDELRALREERRRLRDERLHLAEERRGQRGEPPNPGRSAEATSPPLQGRRRWATHGADLQLKSSFTGRLERGDYAVMNLVGPVQQPDREAVPARHRGDPFGR